MVRKVYFPLLGSVTVPVQRAEKLSAGTAPPGEPDQVKLTASMRVSSALPASATPLK